MPTGSGTQRVPEPVTIFAKKIRGCEKMQSHFFTAPFLHLQTIRKRSVTMRGEIRSLQQPLLLDVWP